MGIQDNAFLATVEDAVRFRDLAQKVLVDVLGDNPLSRLERLTLISIVEEESPRSISQIGRILGHPRQVIQRAANRLIDEGLIEKLPNPDHKASALLAPTKRGLALEKQATAQLYKVVNSLFSTADQNLCRRISKDLKRLSAILEDFGSSRPVR